MGFGPALESSERSTTASPSPVGAAAQLEIATRARTEKRRVGADIYPQPATQRLPCNDEEDACPKRTSSSAVNDYEGSSASRRASSTWAMISSTPSPTLQRAKTTGPP